MITVAQMITISKHAVLKDMNRLEYMFSDPVQGESGAYYCMLRDSKSEKTVPMAWTWKENVIEPEEDRIEIARNLMVNAINSLDMLKG